MTIEEFLEALKISKNKYKWYLNGCQIRGVEGDLPKYQDDIPAADNEPLDQVPCHCPISAVTDDLVDFAFPVLGAQAKLGMSEEHAKMIVAASDYVGFFDKELRAKILEAIGIQEWKKDDKKTLDSLDKMEFNNQVK